MSADRRLSIWNLKNDDDTASSDFDDGGKVRYMKEIIDIAVAGEGLENLRTKSENIELLHTFVSYCLIHFTTSIRWRYNACNLVISDIFTESDEALCILLIENNAHDYAIMQREQRKISRKEAKPKYTKVECIDKKFKGWDRRGIKRFNSIVAAIKRNRGLTESKDMELLLKSRYVQMSGKGAEANNIDSDDDDCDLDELNGYDGFAGDTEINIPTSVNPTNVVELLGATNVTPV